MGEMEMPMPNNTLPMMTGFGQFGPIEMGGMFTVMKVRKDLAHNDYRDPGAYDHPVGTVAQLYATFGLQFDAAFEQRIKAYVAANPNGGYGQLSHRIEDYGIDASREGHRFAGYVDAFGVGPERRLQLAGAAA